MHRKPFSYLWRASGLLTLDVAAVAAIDRWLSSHGTMSAFLALPLAFLFLHAAMVGLVIASLVVRKVRQGLFEVSVERLEPDLLRMLSEHAYGEDQVLEIKKLVRTHRRVVEHVLVAFLPSVNGGAADRLGQMALDIGFVADWKRMASSRQFLRRKSAVVAIAQLPLKLSRDSLTHLLDDPEEEIGILAARGLVKTGEPELIEHIFLMILDRSPLVRASVTEDLRKHAAMLSQGAVRKALAGADEARTGIVLAILGAWRRSLYMDDWESIYDGASPENRTSILRLLPYVITSEQPESQVIKALGDTDDRVRAAASALAGQWRLEAALPALSEVLLGRGVEAAQAAARALTALGDKGKAILQNTILDSGGEPGRIATEALEWLAVAV